jgi:hypothetical protein
MIEKVAAVSLVEDFGLYPRNEVNDTHVNELVKALASGATLPPIIAERSTKRVVDGVHRRRAHIKFYGDETHVDVDFRDYASDADLYLDAVHFNAKHGRRLDRHDQTRIVLRLQELHVDVRVIASALHVPEQEVRTLAVRIVYDDGGTPVPQKRGLEHMRGQRLSDSQIGAMKSVRSAEVGRLCIELVKLLDNELVDYSDDRIEPQLRQLAQSVALALKRIRTFNKGKANTPDAVTA